ncbi:hypothetical protein, variant 1 [Aphanomyces invadans]|uniref:Uncharacterized protein n=1 Tax=Aphanomyces invadans TaxID=157072 RepID=A0A024UDB9_9STRA|nr:hypothetical protein, variant 1 [Aphanomyces invadans]ETW03867.1 hypothetical protein, variant 1 [Aphanomyces invadans]|eukprot:XP_008868096.1 hypothetical protein, variant 1 [Aphanomyces invadans]
MPAADAETPTLDFVGLDIGSKQCVVARPSGDIVLNELGGMTTATLVSFKDKERLLGEAAVLASSTNPTNTVDYVNLLLGKTFDQVMHQLQAFPCQRSNFKANDAGLPVASVEYNGSTVEFSPVQLMAMLLAKIGGNVASDRSSLKVGVAIPPGWSAAEQTALLQAIKIAGFGAASLVSKDVALARCYHQKHPVKDEAAAKTIAIVDVGHVSTTAALVRFSATGETILARAYDGALGSANYDRHLYTHFEAKLKASHGVQIQPESRQSRRLLLACEQLKKLLSTIPDAVVHVENVVPDADITLSMTKTELEQLGHVETTAIRELMEGLFAQTDVAPADIATVEIVGGGTRMPLVQDAITKAIGAHVTLGRMLDSATAVAVGAALSDDVGMFFDVSVHDGDVALEKSMQDLDHNMTMLANKRNEIETFVYDMRAKQGQKHGHLIDSAVVAPLLDAAEDWFYSDDAATLEEATVRVDQFKTDIRNACQAYFAAVEKDEKELEHQLEVEAQKAALENKDDDDHDFRKLKTPDRMRLVVKNKDEGNELFRGGNIQHAAARYVKALTHATKFFDLRPDEAAEVKAIKLSLYLNLAQCYLKLESWQKAVVNCKDALDLDPTNTKALYRRALGYERLKDYAAAFEDSQKAFMLAPGDKAVVALNDRLKAHMKKQEATEKKMWAKAFA